MFNLFFCVSISSPRIQLIVTSSADKTARTWSTADGSPLHEFIVHGQGISDVAFSTNARYLATASGDKTFRLCDVSTGALVKTLTGHTNFVFCVNYNPQSNMNVLVRSMRQLGLGCENRKMLEGAPSAFLSCNYCEFQSQWDFNCVEYCVGFGMLPQGIVSRP